MLTAWKFCGTFLAGAGLAAAAFASASRPKMLLALPNRSFAKVTARAMSRTLPIRPDSGRDLDHRRGAGDRASGHGFRHYVACRRPPALAGPVRGVETA